MTQEENKFILTDANLSEILKKVTPYIEELQLDNHNEPNAGILYDYKLEEALIGLRKILYYLENKSQQPIPQDINKWIEDEAEKIPLLKDLDAYHYPNHAVNVIKLSYWKDGAARILGLLLPELQQLREEIKNLKAMMEFIEKDRQTIREKLETTELIAKGNQNSYDAAKGKINQQKSQIEELKNSGAGLFSPIYSEREDQLRLMKRIFPDYPDGQFLFQYMNGLLQFSLMTFGYRKQVDKQAAEIESLKQHCQDYRKNIDDLDRDLTYWKQRCKAAEEVNRYGHYEVTGTESDVFQEWWDKWQALKQQTD